MPIEPVLTSIKFTLNTLEAAIIDLDRTMVDTLGDFAKALNLMLAGCCLAALGRPGKCCGD